MALGTSALGSNSLGAGRIAAIIAAIRRYSLSLMGVG